jgi:hypothetical protein
MMKAFIFASCLLLIPALNCIGNDKNIVINQVHYGTGRSAETALAQAKKYKGTAQITNRDITYHDDGLVTVRIVTKQEIRQ